MAPTPPAGDTATGDGWSEYLVVFAHHNMYFNMRFQELEALVGLVGVPSRDLLYVDKPVPTALSASPLALVRLPGEEAARKLCERSVLVKAVLEVWSVGSDFPEAVQAALEAGDSAKARRRSFFAPPRTYQIRVEAFGRTASMEDKREIFNYLRPMFDGDEIADLHNPDTTVWALEEHTHLTDEKTHLGPRQSLPKRVLLGRQVAGGRSLDKKLKSGEKAYFQKYELSQRAVLGPTTLDNELAFIMANCARVQSGTTALEPFCGTGGIMVAMSHFGARITAGEIDIRVVKGWAVAYTKNKDAALEASRGREKVAAPRSAAAPEPNGKASGSDGGRGGAPNGTAVGGAGDGKAAPIGTLLRGNGSMQLGYLSAIGLELHGAACGPTPSASVAPTPSQPSSALVHTERLERDGSVVAGRDIFTNFVQYKLQLPEIVVCDNSTRPWRRLDVGWCDCIVTDPPYGVRAASKKQGRDPGKAAEIREMSGAYIAPKVNYGEDELASDLMSLASETLRDGGRLVFLQPVDLADFLGIDRAASERGGGGKGTLRDSVHPDGGRKKDRRLCISETTRDPLILDEARYPDFVPAHEDMELVGASMQILSGGLGRLLVTMRRRPR
mmetsp:Transcript_106604/g.270726  ORF Transcript_106604/g.270726 Transcript_106604/m.270726 type:complete len:614 (-) Transcript_106604:44-1885(-)